MDEKILKLYLDASGTEFSFKATWKKKSRIQKVISIILIVTAAITFFLLIGGLFSKTLLRISGISVAIFALASAIFSFLEKKENTLNNQIEKNINKREILKKILIANGVNSEKRIKLLYDRLNYKYKKHETTVSKTIDIIYGIFKVLIIPSFLAFFNQLYEQNFTLSDIMSVMLLCSLLVIALFACTVSFYRVVDIIMRGHYVNIEMFLSLLDDILGIEDCNALKIEDPNNTEVNRKQLESLEISLENA